MCGPRRALDDASCECVCRNGLTDSSCEPGWRLDHDTCESGSPRTAPSRTAPSRTLSVINQLIKIRTHPSILRVRVCLTALCVCVCVQVSASVRSR